MNVRRVDLIVPGPEGGWLARALEQAGLVVRRRELDEPATDAPALVVVSLALEVRATPRESFERQLSQARAGASPTTPLVALLPVDAQLDDSLRELAQGVYVRPVPVARLVHKIQALLDVAEGRPPRPSWAPTGPPVVPEQGKPPASPSPLKEEEPVVRERTVRLDDVSPPPSPVAASARPPRSSRPPAEPNTVDSEPSSQVSGLVENTQPVAELSPWLHRMLSECDRRMFPAAPPLDLRFPAGDDGPLELVPRALLDALGVPVDPAPGDGFDEPSFALDPLSVSPTSSKRHSEWPRLESSTGGSASGSSVARANPAEGQRAMGSEPPPLTREVALPDARRREEGSQGAAVESVIARRPDEDTRRASRHAARRSSAPPPPSVPPLPPASSAPRTGPPNSSPPMSSAAGLYETAVEAAGFPPVPRVPVPPTSPPLQVGTPTADGRGRWGTLAPEAWMSFAEALRSQTSEHRLSLRTDGPGVLVHVRAGEVIVPRQRHAASVRSERSAEPEPSPLSGLAELRGQRRAAQEAVIAALTPSGGPTPATHPGPEVVFEVYEVAPGEELEQGWPVGSLAGLMAEALLGWATADWLRARWHDDLGRVVRVDPSAVPRLTALGLDPLWLEWLSAHERAPLGRLLSALPEHEALPGVLLALESVDAFTLEDAPEGPASGDTPLALRDAAHAIVQVAYASTRDADYFALLGVPPTASARAIERAYTGRSAQLANLDLAGLDLTELEPLRRDVLECYGEARRVLRDDDARERYARALGLLTRV